MENNQALQERYAGIELGEELERELGISQVREGTEPGAPDEVDQRLDDLFAQTQPSSADAPLQGVSNGQAATQETSVDDTPTDWLDLIARAEVDNRQVDAPEVEVTQTEIDPQFADTFKNTFGFDAAELRDGIKTFQETLNINKQLQAQVNSLIQEVQQVKAAQTHEAQVKSLQQEWGLTGADFEARMQQVLNAYSKLPAHAQQKYGDAQGAKYIWNLIEKEQRTKAGSVPQFDRGRGQSQAGKKALTWGEIDAMRTAKGEAWYEANEPKLIQIMSQQG